MAFKALLVLLAIPMLLTSGTERSKEVSARGRRLCLCSDRVPRLSFQASEASSSASCEEMCTFKSNAGVLSNFTHHLRSRRDVLEDAKKCRFIKDHRNWQVYNKKVAFHRSGSSSEWFAEVSWSPFNGTSLSWIGYYILYFTGGFRGAGRIVDCQIISKNQTSVNISSTEDDERITFNVIALPKSLSSTNHSTFKTMMLLEYANYKPKYPGLTPPGLDVEPTEGTTPRPPLRFRRTSSDVRTKLIAAIVGGAFVALLLVFAVLFYRKQINFPWPCSTCSRAMIERLLDLLPVKKFLRKDH